MPDTIILTGELPFPDKLIVSIKALREAFRVQRTDYSYSTLGLREAKDACDALREGREASLEVPLGLDRTDLVRRLQAEGFTVRPIGSLDTTLAILESLPNPNLMTVAEAINIIQTVRSYA